MDKPKMFLKKRNGWYIFRRPIPKDLQPFIAKGSRTEFIRSLKTKDFKKVSIPYADVLRVSEQVFEEAAALQKASNGRKSGIPHDSKKRLERRPFHEFSRAELHHILHRWYLQAKAAALEERRFDFNVCTPEERQDEIATLKGQLDGLQKRNGENGDRESYATVRRLIENAGGELEWPDRASFLEKKIWFEAMVRECLISLKCYALSILETGTPPAVEFIPPEFGTRTHDNIPASISLNELIRRFESEPNRGDVKPKTRDEFQLVYRMLREAVGEETPIAAISREKIKELQDFYRQLPARFTSLYPDKKMQEIVKLAKADNRPPMERATFNKRMTLLSSLFRYAVREQLLKSSPADGLTIKEKRKTEGEKSFSVDQLQAIFGGPLYQEFARNHQAQFTPNHKLNPHEFWAPLVALFQGFRMEEILQLRDDDVGKQDGVPSIWIREGEGQSVKTDATRRVVPIHPELERLGFLRYVDAVRKAKLKDLFPDATRGKTYGNRSHNYSKRFNRYLAQIGVKEGRNQVFHSFRHTFADGLRVAGVPQDALRRLGGWTDATSSETLYGGRLLGHLRDQLAKLEYEGLDLSHLMPPD